MSGRVYREQVRPSPVTDVSLPISSFNNPSGNITNLQTSANGTFRTGVFEVTGTNAYGRDVAERILRLGLRLCF